MRISYLLAIIVALMLTGCGKAKISWPKSDAKDLDEVQVNLYVENSGSMDGFMHDGFAFKDAVFGYITSINRFVKNTNFFYINSKIIPNSTPLENLSQSFDADAFRAAGGDRSSTNLASMLKMVLDKTDGKTVSVFVSDCILDLPKGAAKNYFINNQISLEAIVSKKLKKQKDLSFVVYRLTSYFAGYFYNSEGTHKIEGTRPYYIMLMGSGKVLGQLVRRVPIDSIPNSHVTSSVAYSDVHVPVMTITNSTGRMFKKNSCTLLQEKGSDNYRIKILCDMSSAFLDGKFLLDKNNYKSSDRQFNVEYVESMKDPDSKYTHIITVSTPYTVQPTEERLTLQKSAKPEWIDQANDDTGTFIGRKTTGIKYVLDGIDKAYTNSDAVEIKFAIKRN